MAAAMGSAMPVLPEVASISVSPGLMSPRASARWIIESAGLSLTEPAGLLPSSLTRMTLPRRSLSAPGIRTRRTSGVLPTKSCSVLYMGVQPVHVLRDALFDGRHRRLITGLAQARQVSLGEGLVLALQRIREGNVFEQTLRVEFGQQQLNIALRLAATIDGSNRDIVERLGTSGAEIENAGLFRVIQEKQVDLGDIANKDEIAHLPTVRVAVRTFEQLDLALGLELVVVVESYRRHATLVGFTRAIDVEITEADDLRRRVLGQTLTNDLVEQKFGVAVHIERPFILALFLENIAATIGGRRGGVEELHVLILAPVEQDQRVAVVVLHHVTTVRLHGVGAGALMQDGLDLAIVVPGLDTFDEILLIKVIGDFAVDQVLELVGLGQVVDGDDVGDAALVQRLDDVGADEAGGAGNDVIHEILLTGRRAVPGG